MVELRPVNGHAFSVRAVTVELRTLQKITIPSKLSLTETYREYKVHEEVVFRPAVGRFSMELLGLDVPVLVALPRDMVSSGYFPRWAASTTHRLCVRVALGELLATEHTHMETFPVVVKHYDTLPLYRQYTEPLREERVLADRQAVVSVTLALTAFGPGDPVDVEVAVAANAAHNRLSKSLRLKQVTVQIKEILECHEGGLAPRRDAKLYTETRHETAPLTTTSVARRRFTTPFPAENDLLAMYDTRVAAPAHTDVAVTTANIARYISMDKLDEGVPLLHTQGFTFAGKLFLMRHEAVVKVKLAHARDVDVRVPIVVCPYDRVSSQYLLGWIKRECEEAARVFGRDAVGYMAANPGAEPEVMRRHVAPPILYRNVRSDWVRLGYSDEAFGGLLQLVQYID